MPKKPKRKKIPGRRLSRKPITQSEIRTTGNRIVVFRDDEGNIVRQRVSGKTTIKKKKPKGKKQGLTGLRG